MSPIGTLRYAQEFFEAAAILQPRPSNALSAFRSDTETCVPVYYLLCHATELCLKAFLYSVGYSEEVLAGRGKRRGKFGHDLLALYDTALEEGLSIHYTPSADDRNLVCTITPYFVRKEIEYFCPGVSVLPKHSLFSDLAMRLLHGVNSRIRETLPNQPPQRNAGSRPSSGDSSVSEAPSSLGPRG